MIIQTTLDLEKMCQSLKGEPFIAVDTEFIREKTYYPFLCLIQIGTQDKSFCIDPLAEEISLAPLFNIFKDENITKVFHAAHQDLEIFYHLMGELPKPIFDTQIGAMVCGFGDSIGYADLVFAVTGISIDKGMRFTDWKKRPLTEEQIQYALGDVTHLIPVFQQIQQRLVESNRMDWLKEEMEILNDETHYLIKPEEAYKRFKFPSKKPQIQHIFAKLCEWREKIAQTKNKPRRQIMSDETLTALSLSHPRNMEEMRLARYLPESFFKSSWVEEILTLITQSLEQNSQNYEQDTSISLNKSQKNQLELLQLILGIICRQHKVASKLVASRTDLALLLKNPEKALCLKGWRSEIFGQKALSFLKGELKISFDPQTEKIIFTN